MEGEALSVVPSCPGRLTEAYDVQKAVGKGGYAVVYKGIRREDGRVVAVKKVEVGPRLTELTLLGGFLGLIQTGNAGRTPMEAHRGLQPWLGSCWLCG